MSLIRRFMDEDEPTPMTTVALDAWLDGQRDEGRWELIGGQVVAMVPPLIAHALIVGNLDRALSATLLGRNCRVFRNDVGVQSADDANRTYRPIPDLVVHCGPLDQRRRFVSDPLVVIEVLSPSTMDLDRGTKLAFYKTVPTLRHIVLLYRDQMRSEHYRRNEDGWPADVLTAPGDVLTLEAIGFRLGLADAYAGVQIG